MTTINAAAALLVGIRSTIAVLIVISAGALAGCSTGGGDLLQGANSPLASNTDAPTATTQARATIAIAPVIGAPDSIAKQIVAQLTTETQKNSIAITGEQVDYTLRGYIVAAREATGTKVSYIWDVTNPTGARVHRITGEEVVNGAGAGDPWASVSPQLIQVIAAKTSDQLNTWLPQKAPTSAASVPVAIAPGSQIGTQLAAAGSSAASTPVTRSGLQPSPIIPGASNTSTSSIGSSGAVTALVPGVVGAPGDGSTSLSAALRNELLRSGIQPSPPGVASYRVEGRVQMGPADNGEQPIKIDWVVRDPKGVSLGTVSQENKIPAGSLNGNWGSTASAAATAATQGILKLLPKQTASR